MTLNWLWTVSLSFQCLVILSSSGGKNAITDSVVYGVILVPLYSGTGIAIFFPVLYWHKCVPFYYCTHLTSEHILNIILLAFLPLFDS